MSAFHYWTKSVRSWMESHSHHEGIPEPFAEDWDSEADEVYDCLHGPQVTCSQCGDRVWSRQRKVDFKWPKNPPPPLMTTYRDYDDIADIAAELEKTAKEDRRERMMEYFQTIGAIAGLASLLLMAALILQRGDYR